MTLALITTITMTSTAALGARSNDAVNASPGPRASVALKLNRGLRGTPMRGLGFLLEREGRRAGVHPAFIAGVAGVESSYGAAMCLPYNAWGISSCGNAWRAPTFGSWREGIRYAARFFKRQWPSARSPWDFHGYCVDRYGNDCPTWPGKVAANMRRLGFGATVSYP